MNQKVVFLVGVAAVLVACGSGISGEYGCGEKSFIDKLSFKSDGTAYVTLFGMEKTFQYKVDGEKVAVGSGPDGVVFTKKGDALEASFPGMGKVTCKKV